MNNCNKPKIIIPSRIVRNDNNSAETASMDFGLLFASSRFSKRAASRCFLFGFPLCGFGLVTAPKF